MVQKLKNLLTKEQSKILETVFVLMLPALLTKILGQLFNLVLASYYGVDDSRLNQFLIANALPELLTTVLMVGAVGTVIIPVLISAKEEKGEEQFYKVYSSILNVSLISFSIISLLIIFFADSLIPMAINLTGSELLTSKAELTNIANMMRLLILPQLVLGISVFISSGLNVYNRFILPQISPLFYNIGRLITMFILVPIMDFSPWALVAGVYVGALMHIIVPIPLFLKLRFKYYPIIDLSNSYLREIIKLGLPRLVVLASDHVGLMINSFLSVAFLGGPAALTYAKSIYLVIPTLFGYTFSYASYPTISLLFLKKRFEEIKALISQNLNQIVFMSMPFIVTIMILRVPLVRLFFGLIPGTELSLVGTYQVAWILLFFSFGLVFITARWFLFSLFYAAKDTVLPSIVSIFSLVSVILLSIAFTNFLSYSENFSVTELQFNISHFFNRSEDAFRPGVGGISLAMSVTYTIEFFILLFLFNKTKLNINLRKLMFDFSKKFLAGFLMLIFMYFTYKIWIPLSNTFPDSSESGIVSGSTTINLIILTTITIVPSFLLYYLLCHFFKVNELRTLRKFLNPLFKIGGLYIK